MERKKADEKLKWIGFGAGLILFLISINVMIIEDGVYLPIFIALSLPSLVISILSVTKKFWLLLIPSAWLISFYTIEMAQFYGDFLYSVIYPSIIVSTLVFFIPFMRLGFKEKD